MTTISRRESRIAAMRVIFAALGNNTDAASSLSSVQQMSNEHRVGLALEDDLTGNIVRMFDTRRDDIEQWLEDAYERNLDNMTTVERAVVSVAVSEMLAYSLTPPRIIINEFVEITKLYGTDKGHGLVNGILDNIAAHLYPSGDA